MRVGRQHRSSSCWLSIQVVDPVSAHISAAVHKAHGPAVTCSTSPSAIMPRASLLSDPTVMYDRLPRHHVRRLRDLGFKEALEPAGR